MRLLNNISSLASWDETEIEIQSQHKHHRICQKMSNALVKWDKIHLKSINWKNKLLSLWKVVIKTISRQTAADFLIFLVTTWNFLCIFFLYFNVLCVNKAWKGHLESFLSRHSSDVLVYYFLFVLSTIQKAKDGFEWNFQTMSKKEDTIC